MFKEEVTERFLRYVQIFSTSDPKRAEQHRPSSENQWDILNLLKKELLEMGLTDVQLDEKGYLIARLSANIPGKFTSIGLLAHVDTASDAPGEKVNPQIHKNYQGGDIPLNHGVVIRQSDNPDLNLYLGGNIISSDGSTLLGADDKAGVAEIMTIIHHLMKNPQEPHGPLEFIFTPDEETGHGMDDFPLEKLKSPYCYTVDAGAVGEMEDQCYYAWKASVEFQGRVIHPGYARGRLVNALTMGAAFISMLPRNESPEATDGLYGNYWPNDFTGGLEKAELQVMIRDFDLKNMERRLQALEHFALAVEAAFPGGKVILKKEKQYLNMLEAISKQPFIMENLQKAMELNDILPIRRPIRGGTDGSRLSEMGIPTPNVFAGGYNFHSRTEWVAQEAMGKACNVLLSLINIWANVP